MAISWLLQSENADPWPEASTIDGMPTRNGQAMKLYTAHRAPSPRRVLMFLVEKNITGIEMVNMDLNGGEHRTPA